MESAAFETSLFHAIRTVMLCLPRHLSCCGYTFPLLFTFFKATSRKFFITYLYIEMVFVLIFLICFVCFDKAAVGYHHTLLNWVNYVSFNRVSLNKSNELILIHNDGIHIDRVTSDLRVPQASQGVTPKRLFSQLV